MHFSQMLCYKKLTNASKLNFPCSEVTYILQGVRERGFFKSCNALVRIVFCTVTSSFFLFFAAWTATACAAVYLQKLSVSFWYLTRGFFLSINQLFQSNFCQNGQFLWTSLWISSRWASLQSWHYPPCKLFDYGSEERPEQNKFCLRWVLDTM